MSRRRELCRNFHQRGSCQYGDRCKFLHESQQQSKGNPFGFGTQSTSQFQQANQQHKPNPHGFGVQNNSSSKGASNFSATYQSPAKPFENKWSRSASVGLTNSSSQRTDRKPETATHKCTDPDSCKRQIAEDFKNEAPLWKLTCYAHDKYLPCDIVGDISFEELRATAYEDAKRGLSFQSIIEKERNLLNSKLTEFDNFLRNPYVSRHPSSTVSSAFGNHNSALTGSQSSAPPTFSSFSQLGTSTKSTSDTRTHPFGSQPGTTIFGTPSLFQTTGQTSVGFKMNSVMPGNSPDPGTFNLGSNVAVDGSKVFSSPNISQQFPSSFSQFPSLHDGPQAAPSTVYEASMGVEEGDGSDSSIWLKEEWNIGEIPESEPPRRFC